MKKKKKISQNYLPLYSFFFLTQIYVSYDINYFLSIWQPIYVNPQWEILLNGCNH